MGYGVYTSDFHGSGKTFNVAGPLGTDEDYAAYAKEAEDPLDRETWSQDEYDDFVDDMHNVMASAAEELGMSASHGHGRDFKRADFDSEFVGVASNDVVEIGWRSWQHDFVVGIGPTSYWKDWMTGDEDDFVLTKARAFEGASDEYANLVAAVEEYVRLSMMEAGIECRFRTGSYTSSAYELEGTEEDRSGIKKDLKERIAALTKSLSMEGSTRIKNATSDERVALLKEIEQRRLSEFAILVPFYDAEEDDIVLWKVERNEPVIRLTASPDVMEMARDLPRKGALAPMPWDDTTKDIFQSYLRGRAGDTLIVTPEEYSAGMGEDLEVTYEDASGEDVTVQFAASAVEPRP